MKLFLDTSFLTAEHNRRDANHCKAKSFLNSEKKSTRELLLVTTDYVLDEFLTLLMVRVGKHKAIEIGEKVLGDSNLTIVNITDERFDQAWGVFLQFQDKDWSFTDCASYVVINELGIQNAAAFDRHFNQFGLNVMP